MRTLALSILLLAYSSLSAQQRRLIEYGNVTMEELKMSIYEKDSTASAVILHDKGYFNGDEIKFTRHVRVKILSHAGTSFGNFTIRVPSKSFIDGYTFNLENGLLRKTKLEKANIYEEEIIDGFDVYKIFFPEVKPGAVIDLRYTHLGMPFEWRFQDFIPVRYSELKLEPTSNIYFKKVFYGFENISTPRDNEYVAEYMPAIKVEPLMNHYSNYVTRFQFDVEAINIPRLTFYKEFTTSWEKVGRLLLDSEYFGGVIRGSSFLNEKARDIERSTATVPEKIDTAVNYIRENIKWNHDFGVIAARSYREDFRTRHSGNSATINLLLIALLKKAGLNVFPVILSTRNNGIINPLSASLNKLNFVLAVVEDGDRFLLIDASDPYAVPGVLPEHCLNVVGWLIKDAESGRPIDLTPGRAKTVRRFIKITSNALNEFVAEVTNTYEGYAYMDWVAEFEKNGSENDHAELLKSRNIDAPIDSYDLVSQDKMNLKASERLGIKLSGTNYLQPINDNEFVLNPLVFSDIVNPFKSNGRLFPIDFVYPRSSSIVVSMELPPGYALRSYPPSSRVVFPDDKAKFQLLSSVNNNILIIRVKFSVNQTFFLKEDYEMVKTFYTEVIKKLSESVQIEKKT